MWERIQSDNVLSMNRLPSLAQNNAESVVQIDLLRKLNQYKNSQLYNI